MATVIPLLATPSGAAVTTQCAGNQYPSRFGAQSKLTIDCTAAAGATSNNIQVHDGDVAVWHHGAARTVAGACSSAACKAQKPDSVWPASTAAVSHVGSPIIKLQTLAAATATVNGLLPGTGDIGRPITGLTGTTEVLAGGSYIVAITTFTGGEKVTLSQNAKASATSATFKIEHTTSRVLSKPTCVASSTTITEPTTPAGQHFQPSDLGKSVSGQGIPAGDFISVAPGANSSTATLNVAATGVCNATGELVEVGAQTISGGVPVWNSDPMTLQLSNNTGAPSGFTCPSATSIGMTADSKAETGGFVAGDVGLNVTVRTTVIAGTPPVTTVTTHTIGRITSVNTTGNTTATMTSTPANTSCTGLVAPNSTHSQTATIGVAGAGAPNNSDAMMTLGAELNLAPSLVATQDSCTANTLEGFMVVGGWENPGTGYSANTSTPTASVGQVLFPTSVISFAGWVTPQKGGETLLSYSDANPHYTFTFPLLPTSVAECTSGGVPTNPTGLEFTINPVALSKAPFLPTGSGNVADPTVRSLMGQSASPNVIVTQQINNTGPVENSKNTTTCTIQSLTSDPTLGGAGNCGTT